MDYFMSSDEYHNDLYEKANRINENFLNEIRINETRIYRNGNGQNFFREQLIR
jgi:chemotaxis methyl-accepting protein methylase